MQECFKKYPEIYGSELADDEDDEAPADLGSEAPLADRQQPRDTPAELDVKDNGPETHNPPGGSPVEDKVASPWEDARGANKEVKSGKKE